MGFRSMSARLVMTRWAWTRRKICSESKKSRSSEHSCSAWQRVRLGSPSVTEINTRRISSSQVMGRRTDKMDKPLKYPTIFNSTDVAIVSKMDLAAAVEFNWETAYNNIQAVRPGMPVFQLSSKTGDGMQMFLDFLASRLTALRNPATV